MAQNDKTALTLSILEQVQALGPGSKVMVNNSTYLKMKGLLGGTGFPHTLKSPLVGGPNIQVSPYVKDGDIYFFDPSKSGGIQPTGKLSLSHGSSDQELMPSALEKQLAAMKLQAEDFALDQQMTATAAKNLSEEMKAKVSAIVEKSFSGVKVVPHMVFDDASIEPGNPTDKLFSKQVNDTVTQESGLKASLNAAVHQNKRLVKENVELKEEIAKLRAHHASCMPEPPQESDALSARFGNIASNL